mmetsp:Transcript_34078/g.71763  ORF Transcript_34078/g.71763 Transcript_34078/m.71763 type:complete len:143 (+) Transcript_34078:171-599(+)
MDEPTTPQDATSAAGPSAVKSENTTSAAADSAPTSAPIQSKEPIKGEETDNDDNDEPDEEDNLFTAIEQQEEASHKNDAQPHDATAAPRLLQQALKEGKVGVDDSEAESEEGHKKEAQKKKAEEKKEEDSADQHGVHARVSV